ncbi:mitogen-activated protein-binding protein-interacting protein [Syncephalis fuscata]|nr:mitogen-activated protein-binding protein-interacting protein [Syncephalis fuscata]
MIKPKVIAQVLQQAVTGGVETALLLTRDGAILASATASGADTAIRAAVAASVWKGYEACLQNWSSTGDNARWILLECEQGRAMVYPVGELLVALVANTQCEIGMLKLKAEALVKHFDEPLKNVAI